MTVLSTSTTINESERP